MTAEKKERKKIALVTGANRGLGFETCRQLARLGLTVILSARDFTKGEVAAKQLVERGLDVIFYELDVLNQSHMNRITHQIEQRFGRLDVLVNNAAILYDTWQSTLNANLDVVNQALTTNLFGPWRLSQLCIPLMKRNNYGRIVNVSSGAGSLHYMGSGSPAYSVSKAALNAFSCIFAADLHGTGILVNSVGPGWVATDMGGRGGRPVGDGAKGIVWAATLPDNGPSGGSLMESLLHGR
ncbi:MAG: SDR family NAD(P)-dependent oxidoreductase [Nitrososphaeraceae archaeon]|jgi:NAD(P)-dependent dehydrogenase (short-subunit alcohol dehydrogenase family)|nr:SDR family NAD(P)-dependent oxidoreductase [Nitrososphaeraceae archaeon]